MCGCAAAGDRIIMIVKLGRGQPRGDHAAAGRGPGSAGARPGPADGRVRRPGRRLVSGLLALAAAAAGASAYAVTRPPGPGAGHQLRPSGIPAGISTALADLMSLTPLPRTPAPWFTLTDQAGRTMSLSGFRGKVVVLGFMDDHCTDICPIVAQGTQRSLASPEDEGATKPRTAYGTNNETGYVPPGQMADWGHGIALLARSRTGWDPRS